MEPVKVPPRPLSDDERAVLEALLAHDFDGAETLRSQMTNLFARPCACGCATIELLPDGQESDTTEPAQPVPVEGEVRAADGSVRGGILLFVRRGQMSSLEFYAVDDEPLMIPPLTRIEWTAPAR